MAKVMISLPDSLLSKVDAAATSEARSRSDFVREALRRYLAGSGAQGRLAAIERLREGLGPGTWIAEELVRSERDR